MYFDIDSFCFLHTLHTFCALTFCIFVLVFGSWLVTWPHFVMVWQARHTSQLPMFVSLLNIACVPLSFLAFQTWFPDWFVVVGTHWHLVWGRCDFALAFPLHTRPCPVCGGTAFALALCVLFVVVCLLCVYVPL